MAARSRTNPVAPAEQADVDGQPLNQHDLSRRAFVKAAALLGAGGFLTAGGLVGLGSMAKVSAAADLDMATPEELALRQWAFVFDLRRCDGCGRCTRGCQRMHYLPEGQEWIKVYTVTGASGQTFFLPVLCQLCEQAPCVQVCPVVATFKAPDGVVLMDQEVCIGCRMCMAACPYGVRTFNWQKPAPLPAGVAESSSPLFTTPQKQGTVGKCDSCAHRLREGDFPACVTACDMEAIYVGDLVADVATNGRQTVVLSDFLRTNDAFRLKEELGTQPRVYYIAGHGQALEF